MKKIKRILTVILVIIMCLNFGTLDSKAAASVSIALSASSISMGTTNMEMEATRLLPGRFRSMHPEMQHPTPEIPMQNIW